MDIQVLENEIRKSLKKRMENGESERQISEKIGISSGHINHLKNGTKKVSALSLGNFLKMFPEATIHLYGDTVEIKDNSGTAYGIVHGNVKNIDNKSGIPKDIMDSILSNSDLSVTEKAQLLKELMGKTS